MPINHNQTQTDKLNPDYVMNLVKRQFLQDININMKNKTFLPSDIMYVLYFNIENAPCNSAWGITKATQTKIHNLKTRQYQVASWDINGLSLAQQQHVVDTILKLIQEDHHYNYTNREVQSLRQHKYTNLVDLLEHLREVVKVLLIQLLDTHTTLPSVLISAQMKLIVDEDTPLYATAYYDPHAYELEAVQIMDLIDEWDHKTIKYTQFSTASVLSDSEKDVQRLFDTSQIPLGTQYELAHDIITRL